MKLLCIFILLVAVGAVVTCIGCWKRNEPAVIRWRGEDGGFTDTTSAPPGDHTKPK